MKFFYHGTNSESKALKILQEGICPDLSETQGLARPVDGHIYLAKNLKEAIPYLLGGAMAGHELPKEWINQSKYGYIFVVAETKLEEYQPDEDQVGQAISDNKFNWVDKYESFLENHPPLDEEEEEHQFHHNLLQQVRDGEYAAWIKAGHLLLPQLSSKEKKDIIEYYGNIAHKGVLIPDEAWQFDKTLSNLLEEDGSNFFQLAKRVL